MLGAQKKPGAARDDGTGLLRTDCRRGRRRHQRSLELANAFSFTSTL